MAQDVRAAVSQYNVYEVSVASAKRQMTMHFRERMDINGGNGMLVG